LEGFHLQDQAQ